MNEAIKNRIEQVRRGEVPEGYSFVLPYIIPSDWCVKKMGRVASRIARPNREDTGLPAYSINNQVGFVPQSEQFEDGSYGFLDKSSYKIVHRGEFAYNPARINVGSIGRLKTVDKAIVSSLYVCFALSDENSGEYLEKWLQSFSFYEEVIRNLEGSVREYLFFENFSNIRIPLPSHGEQLKIAEILTCCDQVISLKKQLLEEKRRQKKWLMQKLLDPDGGLRALGLDEKSWIQCSLEDLCFQIIDGDWIESKDQNEAGIRIIQTGNIGEGVYLDKPSNGRYIDEATFYRLNCSEVFSTDVLISRLPDPIGRSCRAPAVKGRMVTAVDCTIARFKSQIVADLFVQYSQTNKYLAAIANLSGGSTRTRITRKELEKIVVPIPCRIEDQKLVLMVLSQADSEINLLEQELILWQQKKKALMQLLLTGIVRVNV